MAGKTDVCSRSAYQKPKEADIEQPWQVDVKMVNILMTVLATHTYTLACITTVMTVGCSSLRYQKAIPVERHHGVQGMKGLKKKPCWTLLKNERNECPHSRFKHRNEDGFALARRLFSGA